MTLIKGFTNDSNHDKKGMNLPVVPRERKLQMSKTQKNFVVNRKRNRKRVVLDRY